MRSCSVATGRPVPGDRRPVDGQFEGGPGRYSRKLGRELPISTEGREDGGTVYYFDEEAAALFAAARPAG